MANSHSAKAPPSRMSSISSYDHYDAEAGKSESRHGDGTESGAVKYALFGKERVYKGRGGETGCWLLVGAIIFCALLVTGAVVFGTSVGVERGLTGEYFWTPGHSELFRICESSSTASTPFQAHTCNVFRPGHDVDAAPLHSFTETVRNWDSLRHASQGRATRVEQYKLDALLLNEGLRCTPANSPDRGAGSLDASVQLIIGAVGQSYFTKKTAVACNYDRAGQNAQTYCARYGDGGQLNPGKVHPLGINQIFQKHFGMNCTWV